MPPKYSHAEIERRWLVEATDGLQLSAVRARTIEDKYVTAGRLRLRKICEQSCPPVFKLGKKYERTGSEPELVVNIYLSEAGYQSLSVLPGRTATKVRYSVEGGALDVYEAPNHALVIFEMEFTSCEAAAAYVAPRFVGAEVTAEEKYTGFALSDVAV
jgi:CYTH domain-containing protein